MPQWILPPASCEFIAALAQFLPPPATAFEFGSGRSTHALRRVFSAVTSVESSSEWLADTEKLPEAIARRPLDSTAVVPLRRVWNRLRLIQTFPVERRPELLRSLGRARLILVDSPPNPAKREHALFIAMRHASAGAVIVVDDMEVGATSRFAMRLARQNAASFRYWNLSIDHQLGVFLKRVATTKIRSIPSAREIVGAWLRV